MHHPGLSRHLDTITRVEVIDADGRAFIRYYEPGVALEIQDEGRTLKIFAGESVAPVVVVVMKKLGCIIPT